ncbi:MAG: type I restriction enzyme HsdR N-terminal domain-containing protein [Deltaproteobacteria bacterium]|nr:MAG: type I restriction enzyme HsdR N-terminal domain-containing protein [Deltaproteobacteria bacterium]
MADIPSHHYIYGTCTDFITGDTIVDTDDERCRQDLAKFLVEKKGYSKSDLEPRLCIETLYNGQFVASTIDITVRVAGKRLMILRFAPGSIVTRERSAIAAARVLEPEYQIPLAVVTNCKDAEVLDTYTGKVIRNGLENIPDRKEAESLINSLHFDPFNDETKKDRERRILNAYDVEICCAGGPCALPGAPEG